jgi:2-C-methyl-D-erythritol 4-phosphate cytidylyltransferase
MTAVNTVHAGPRYWAVVPAAGSGRRLGSDIPKQYLPIQGQAVLWHTLQRLAQLEHLRGIVIALAADDPHWPQLASQPLRVPVWTVTGGTERAHSVHNALTLLTQHAATDDWVLVHDAARPCVRVSDMQRLIDTVQTDAVGGVLAMPVRDTMKRADAAQRVAATIERTALWHALTPQMFRLGMLSEALASAFKHGVQVTDEAMAIELTGQQPLLVEGSADNIKITRREDLELVKFYLQQQLNVSA